MSAPNAAMLVIGDEILSGRTRDANMHHLAQCFTEAGIDLDEVRVVSDKAEAIVAAIRDLSAAYDVVVTSGGIGPTHDDITADCVAAAFGVGIDVREDARAILAARYEEMGTELNEARLRMARIPDGARLIRNKVSGAPGFIVENVHVMAGVPSVFQAMLAEVLPGLGKGARILSKSLRVERAEGDIAGPLAAVAAAHPAVSIGSYPFHEGRVYGANLVVRSRDEEALNAAFAELEGAFSA